MRVDPSVAESVSIWFRLLTCHARMLAEIRRGIETAPSRRPTITLARFDLLASLHRRDGSALSSLSEALLVSAGNVTGLVARAERDGLVRRAPDAEDRRVVRVWLTRKGRTTIERLLPIHAEHVHRLLEGLAPLERRRLRKTLGTLRGRLEDAGLA